MKKLKRTISFMLGLTMMISICSGTTAFATSSLKSDTTLPFNLELGKSYTFKITANNTNSRPVITVANGNALKVVSNNKIGNDYYFKVIAIGQTGTTSGVYMALPGQKAVRCCIVTVGTTENQQTVTTTSLNNFKYITEQPICDNDNYVMYFVDANGNESSDWLTGNAGEKYNKGLLLRWRGASYYIGYEGGVYRDYLINGNYKKITGTFAIPENRKDASTFEASMKIFGDGKLLHESDTLKAGVLPQSVDVDLSGVKILRIEMDGNGNFDKNYVYAGLYNAMLSK